jgi:hypothetical protein
MSVSGLVVTLSPDSTREVDAVHAIRSAGPFTVGESFGHRLAVALQAESPRAAERWHAWLHHLPGVVKVDVAFVALDPVEETADAR